MHPRKRAMIGFISLGIGAAAYTAVSINNEVIRQQEARYQQILLAAMQSDPGYRSPLAEVELAHHGEPVSHQQLPDDAIPTPGYSPEPGSAPKKIVLRSGQPSVISPRPVHSIIVERTKDTVPVTGDPIWKVSLINQDGQRIDELKALSGRANKQTANRHQSGNKSPLPDGVYAIDTYGISRGPFGDPELGTGYWVPIIPLFSTGRSALGFHQDPSWGKENGESGTSGCVGLESPEATTRLVDWIREYKINKVIVTSRQESKNA